MEQLFSSLGIAYTTTNLAILVAVVIWTMIWKGVALWRSAQNRHTVWFVIIFLVNTVGLLEIIYIFVFSKKGAEAIPTDGHES